MRSFVLLSLAGSTLAVPFTDVFANLFGRYPQHPGYPLPTGTGLPLPTDFPFPTGTGLPFPTGTFPSPTDSAGGLNPASPPNPPIVPRVLKINYSLAPQKIQNYGTWPAAAEATGAVYPTETEPALPFPTGGFPTGAPSDGYPTGAYPGFPTTLATLTRGPAPTGEADYPASSEAEQAGTWWQGWI